MKLEELPDWNCCGASSAHSTNAFLSLALPMRNLVIAEQQESKDLILPCAACYNLLKDTDHQVRCGTTKAAKVNQEVAEVMKAPYQGTVNVKHPLEVLTQKDMLAQIDQLVKKPLKGLKVVTYYGCLLTRPYHVAFDNPEQPKLMDELLRKSGAEVLRWSYKTDCCGGSLSVSQTGVVVDIIKNLVEAAQQAGAQAIATACPLCLGTLDTRQDKVANKMPVFYFTELLGISFGSADSRQWMKKHIIDPMPLLQSLQLV
jgi:heterodisulfide reductase subunit B